MPLIITRRPGDEMDLGDPRSPTLRLRVVAIRSDAVDLSLHPLKPVQVMLQEDLPTLDEDRAPHQPGQSLSITRAEGQAITCGDPRHPLVVIAVAAIKSDRARLSFDAQRFFDIHAAKSPTRFVTASPPTRADGPVISNLESGLLNPESR